MCVCVRERERKTERERERGEREKACVCVYSQKHCSRSHVLSHDQQTKSHAYHDEGHMHSVIIMLGSDPDALLVGFLTLHLCPQVSVEENSVTS